MHLTYHGNKTIRPSIQRRMQSELQLIYSDPHQLSEERIDVSGEENSIWISDVPRPRPFFCTFALDPYVPISHVVEVHLVYLQYVWSSVCVCVFVFCVCVSERERERSRKFKKKKRFTVGNVNLDFRSIESKEGCDVVSRVDA